MPILVLRDRRLLIEPRDERFRVGHVRGFVQRAASGVSSGMGVAAPFGAVGAFFVR